MPCNAGIQRQVNPSPPRPPGLGSHRRSQVQLRRGNIFKVPATWHGFLDCADGVVRPHQRHRRQHHRPPAARPRHHGTGIEGNPGRPLPASRLKDCDRNRGDRSSLVLARVCRTSAFPWNWPRWRAGTARADRQPAPQLGAGSEMSPTMVSGQALGARTAAAAVRFTWSSSASIAGPRWKGSTGWSAGEAALAMAQARSVQLHTWWSQGSCVRKFAYALRPLFTAGWTWEECARELGRWTVPLRPRHVASYIAAEIRRRVATACCTCPTA